MVRFRKRIAAERVKVTTELVHHFLSHFSWCHLRSARERGVPMSTVDLYLKPRTGLILIVSWAGRSSCDPISPFEFGFHLERIPCEVDTRQAQLSPKAAPSCDSVIRANDTGSRSLVEQPAPYTNRMFLGPGYGFALSRAGSVAGSLLAGACLLPSVLRGRRGVRGIEVPWTSRR